MKNKAKIVIVGAGPGGICMGVALKQAGINDFLMLERAPRVGGTWAHNVYPGSACDAKSRMYSYSFELNDHWSRPWAKQAEIQTYFEHCATKYGLREHLRLGTGLKAAHWDDECTVWRLLTDSAEVITADIFVSAMGLFNEPNWPTIAGLDRFKGTLQHSARWDPATDLSGATVAMIGTGASSIQIVPAIASQVRKIYVFQRTAPWVLPKPDAPYSTEEIAEFVGDPLLSRLKRLEIYNEYERFIDVTNVEMRNEMQAQGEENLQTVTDPELRRRLTPSYPYGFSRPLFSSEYLPTFNLGHVELVTDSIREITPTGITTTDGKERAVDQIILATGFHAQKWVSTVTVTGRSGLSIQDAWKDGAIAYLGITTSGFPNMFMLYGPNTNNGSILFMIECQVAYICRHIERMTRDGIAWIDVKKDAMKSYNEKLQEALQRIDVWNTDSHGYYRNASGRIVTQYPHTMSAYRAATMTPDADAFEFQYGTSLAR